jgi:hypothetical protein
MSAMIESIPDFIDVSQDYMVKHWEGELGVTRGRLRQAADLVGNNSKKIRKLINDGHRIAIRDESGIGRQIVRITLQNDGFGAHVPYHTARNGWIFELPLDYTKTDFKVPLSAGKHFTVSDVVKLSFHMTGFVQFSSSGGRPILSGYNPSLDLVKGAGLRAPDPVKVTTGPLFGVQVYGIEHFAQSTTKPVEMFEPDDLWYRVGEATECDTAYNIEVFMFPNEILRGARAIDGKQILRRRLPYSSSQVWFEHDIRILELPRLPFFLGVIVSRSRAAGAVNSGYKIMGPSCGGVGETKRCIGAEYPCPKIVSTLNPTSLDYPLPETTKQS